MKIITYPALVLGSGAAGFNAACRLKERGIDVAIVTDGILRGTSRNAGSDKQTYYKLNLGGKGADSVRQMAEDLFRGGSTDGDTALCEAAESTRCFMRLCELGVPFPTNPYGEYIGYKTDHDPYARGTSAGPLTSRLMTEKLEEWAKTLEIPVLDGYRAVELLKKDERICGFLAVKEGETVAFRCADLILAIGGPSTVYADSVYPECHSGGLGLALKIGATMQNLALWQYGLASVKPRWNVSGTYMQVLPRFISIDENGVEREFLQELPDALSLVFLKGYQWPYSEGRESSKIDRFVRLEKQKGRKIYLDFTQNPSGLDRFSLIPEAYDYLTKADALFGTPIDRLRKMNAPAIELYQSKGVDLTKEYLEIALCAQHCNGGIAVDRNWRTSVAGLYAIGECAGTHGLARPGGAALNAGQVGGKRAAEEISRHPEKIIAEADFLPLLHTVSLPKENSDIQQKMGLIAGAVREKKAMEELLSSMDPSQDPALTQAAVLTAMLEETCDPATVQELQFKDGRFTVRRRAVRPLPPLDDCFETVWREYTERETT